jgi:hypothetical protein
LHQSGNSDTQAVDNSQRYSFRKVVSTLLEVNGRGYWETSDTKSGCQNPLIIKSRYMEPGMPKKAHLANHYSSEELKQKYLKSQDAVESRRWHLLWKISLGWTIKNSAIAVGINYDYAKQIVKKYNCLGAEGLTNLRLVIVMNGYMSMDLLSLRREKLSGT